MKTDTLPAEEIARVVAAVQSFTPAPQVPEVRKTPDLLRGDVCIFCGDPAELICYHCEAKAKEEEAAREQEAAESSAAARWARFREAFGRYADAEATKLPDGPARQGTARYIIGGNRGLLIIGPARHGKTMSACWLARREMEAGASVDFIQAGDFRAMIGKTRDWENAQSFRRLAKVDVLVMDDFGNHDLTRASEEAFLSLFERRIREGKRTFVTSQYDAEMLKVLFTTPQMADAILRRIGSEFAMVINTKTGDIKP